jgi:hypothetical protein
MLEEMRRDEQQLADGTDEWRRWWDVESARFSGHLIACAPRGAKGWCCRAEDSACVSG